MRNELIPLFKGRPPVVKKEGQIHFVSVHDAAYMRTLRTLRTELVSCHPDRGGQIEEFLRLKKALDKFKHRERVWYWKLGLMPPDMSIPLCPPPDNWSVPFKERQEIKRVKRIHPEHPRECSIWSPGGKCQCRFGQSRQLTWVEKELRFVKRRANEVQAVNL